jgi:hypothetical protein
MCTARLPVVDWTDAPSDLNGLVRFVERRNLVSARVPSHFKRSLTRMVCETDNRPPWGKDDGNTSSYLRGMWRIEAEEQFASAYSGGV